ncbi:hypothetical protein H4S08_004812 [Coemansia sp. RSA 1365]|nr:hypothetical protein H4S08_004812 [Coemansia sp. RSA 1365]
MDVETHLNEDGTARLCTAPFSLVGKHVCSVQQQQSTTETSSNGNNIRQQQALLFQGSKGNSRSAVSSPVHGGHTLVHDTVATVSKDVRRHVKAIREANSGQSMVVESTATVEEEDESMDVDVPDAEKSNQKSALFETKIALGGKGRITADSVQLLRGHTAPVFLCAWCPAASNVLATGAGDGTARIWDLSRQLPSDDEQPIVLRHDSESLDSNSSRVDVTSIVWNDQGTLLATACFNGQLRIWSAKGELKQSLQQRAVPIISMRWNRKGSYLLSAYLDGTVAMWDVSLGQLRHEYKAHIGCVLDVDWLDNSTFASCGSDRAVKVWRDNDNSAPIKTFTGHKSDINAIKWHPGGKYLASASDDGTVKIWSISGDSQQPVQDFFGHSQQVYLVRWLPRADKAIVASASFDGNVRVWDVYSKACIRVLTAHTKAVDCLSFSSDARYLATGSFDKKVCVWNIKDGSLEKTYLADDAVHDVQWAAKGKVAAAIANSNVAVFDPLVNN